MTSNILDKVLTAPEAEQLWGLSAGTVRAACGRGTPAANLPARGWSLAKRWKRIMESVQITSQLTRRQVRSRVMSKALVGKTSCHKNTLRAGYLRR